MKADLPVTTTLRTKRTYAMLSLMADEQSDPFHGRGADLKKMMPALFADVYLYATSEGGKRIAALPGWGCPCTFSNEQPFIGYDGWPVLDEPLNPGERRAAVPFVFLSAEGADKLREAGRFFLCEGKVVGEAIVVRD